VKTMRTVRFYSARIGLVRRRGMDGRPGCTENRNRGKTVSNVVDRLQEVRFQSEIMSIPREIYKYVYIL